MIKSTFEEIQLYYKIDKVLQTSTFSKIYKITNKITNKSYVLKKITILYNTNETQEN